MQTARSVHLLGIGGIGTSALGQWLMADGWAVTGSDRVATEITDGLRALGVAVTIEPRSSLPERTTLLVYSDAVPADDPARVRARREGIPERSYFELLSERTAALDTVAVAGSHGKSSTTVLIGLLLEALGRDPLVIVGTRVKAWQAFGGLGNVRVGRGRMAVIEADEYRSHFLSLFPRTAVVTNVDYDHVDAFPAPADYEAAFAAFVSRVPAGGTVVLPWSDPATPALRAAVTPGASVVTFSVRSTSEAEKGEVVASLPAAVEGRQEFSLHVSGKDWGAFSLYVPGVHMVSNVAAAVAAALPSRITPEVVRKAMKEFRGTWRRFEHVGTVNGAPLISDYAHHPTELKALAAAARQRYPRRRLLIAFQPHQRARTRAFAREFLAALKAFDAIVLAEVYDVAGRDEAEPVTTKVWADALRAAGWSALYAPTLAAVADAIRAHAEPDDVVLIAGAGDIDTVARQLASSDRLRGHGSP